MSRLDRERFKDSSIKAMVILFIVLIIFIYSMQKIDYSNYKNRLDRIEDNVEPDNNRIEILRWQVEQLHREVNRLYRIYDIENHS